MNTTLLIALPVASALLASYVTHLLALKAKKLESISKFKQEKYENLLVKLQGFVGITANAKSKQEFFEEYYRSWIYASDNVILAIDEMLDLVRSGNEPDPQTGRKAIAKIVKEMRADLWKKTNLDDKYFTYIDVLP